MSPTSGLLLVAITTVLSAQVLKECNDNQQCINQTITNSQISCAGFKSCANSGTLTSKDKRNGYITCSGYQSCKSKESISTNKNLNCNGGYSCDGVQSISTKNLLCNGFGACTKEDWQNTPNYEYDVGVKLYCTGSESCMWNTFNVGKMTSCDGYRSCYGNRINGGNSVTCSGYYSCNWAFISAQNNKFVLCSGRWSCINAIIRSTQDLRLYGQYAAQEARIVGVKLIRAYAGHSLYMAKIDSDNKPEMTVRLYIGGNTDAEIICRSASVCNVECKSNGCAQVSYKCETGATCNITPNGCKFDNSVSAINGIGCPTFSTADSFGVEALDLTQIKKAAMDDYTENKQRKLMEMSSYNEQSTTRCLTESECSGQIINNMTYVYCNGVESCRDASITINQGSGQVTGNSINCYGTDSCLLSELNNNPAWNSNVYCNGEDSCQSSEYSISGDLECQGINSCDNAQPSPSALSTRSRVCSGSSSCTNMRLEDSLIYCEGNRGCDNTNINTSNVLYCWGNYGCKDAIIDATRGSYFDDIQCVGAKSCNGATIKMINENQDLEIMGYLAGMNANIFAYSTKGYGYRSLAFSTFDSKDQVYDRFGVTYGGYQAGYKATFICRARGPQCNIYCSGTGCFQLDLIILNDADYNLLPTACLDNSGGIMDDTNCPNILTSITNEDELQEFLRQKEMQREKDQVWIEIHEEMRNEQIEFDLINDYEDEYDYQYNNGEVVIGDLMMENDDDMRVLLGISGGSLIIFGLMYCLYHNMKNKDDHEYIAIK